MKRSQGADEQQLVESIKKWLTSPEGKAEVKRTMAAAREVTDSLQKARRLTPDELNQPVTL